MRFYTKRTPRTRRGEIVSERIQIVDSRGELQTFAVDERDAGYICDALNVAAKGVR